MKIVLDGNMNILQPISKRRFTWVITVILIAVILIVCAKCYTSQQEEREYSSELSQVESHLNLIIYYSQRCSDILPEHRAEEFGHVIEGISNLHNSIIDIASLYNRDCNETGKMLFHYVDFLDSEYKNLSNESKLSCLSTIILSAECFQSDLKGYSNLVPVDEFLMQANKFALSLTLQ